MRKINLLPLALLAISHQAFAQQLPGAGSQIQQIPPTPVPQRAPPEIRIESGVAPVKTGAVESKILVNSLRITGSKAYSEAELLALTGFV